MRLSTEIIQSRVLEDFESQLNEYYKQCENDYMNAFRERIISGEIDFDGPDYRDICLHETNKYKEKISKDSLQFIKSYINNTFDVIDDSLREGIFNAEEAEAAFLTLRHILIAAEMDADKNTKNA